jgi:hypothetical protein
VKAFTMDWRHTKLKGTVFGIHDWLNYLQDQAAKYRRLVEQADDPFVKAELLARWHQSATRSPITSKII